MSSIFLSTKLSTVALIYSLLCHPDKLGNMPKWLPWVCFFSLWFNHLWIYLNVYAYLWFKPVLYFEWEMRNLGINCYYLKKKKFPNISFQNFWCPQYISKININPLFLSPIALMTLKYFNYPFWKEISLRVYFLEQF